MKLSAPSKVAVLFHNGSNYGYHFFIKDLANKFKEQFECLEENNQRYKTLTVVIEKETRKIYEDSNESVVTISCKRKFIDSARFMES